MNSPTLIIIRKSILQICHTGEYSFDTMLCTDEYLEACLEMLLVIIIWKVDFCCMGTVQIHTESTDTSDN